MSLLQKKKEEDKEENLTMDELGTVITIIVEKKKGESKDDIIGKFRRLCLEEDITEEVRKRTAYVKPSEERYAKKKIIVWRDKCRRRAKNSRRHNVKR